MAFDDKNLTDVADPDALVVDGTPGPDRVTASSPQPGTLRLSGLAAVVELSNADAGGRVDVNVLAGADSLTTGVGVTGAGTIGFDGGDQVDSASYTARPSATGSPPCRSAGRSRPPRWTRRGWRRSASRTSSSPGSAAPTSSAR